VTEEDSGFTNPVEFFLLHYNTTILQGYRDSDGEPQIMNILIDKRTQPDNKAISQVLNYLHVNRSIKQIEKEVREYQRRVESEI
jgi:hypothetical protein